VLRRDQIALGLTDVQVSRLCAVGREEVVCDACHRAKLQKKHPKARAKQPRNRARERRERALVRAAREPDRAESLGAAVPEAPGASGERRAGRVTIDTAGPNEKSRRGFVYSHVAVFHEDAFNDVSYSRKKNGVLAEVKEKMPLWNMELKTKLNEFACDRGGEYRNARMDHLCAKWGMRRVYTAPDSSSGPAENKIRTLQNMSLACLLWAAAPTTFWVRQSTAKR